MDLTSILFAPPASTLQGVRAPVNVEDVEEIMCYACTHAIFLCGAALEFTP